MTPHMIKVTPKLGERVRNPFSQPPGLLPPEGALVADDRYWHRRAREGSLTIDLVAIAPVEAPAKKKDK